MSVDRFIDWGTFPEWGAPTIDRLAAVARDYLGERWTVALRQGRDLDLCWIDCWICTGLLPLKFAPVKSNCSETLPRAPAPDAAGGCAIAGGREICGASDTNVTGTG